MWKFFRVHKKTLIFFVILEFFIASFIYFIQQEEFTFHIDRSTHNANSQYKQLYASLKIHANTIFSELVDQEDVLILLKQAQSSDKGVQNRAREALYHHLLKPYQRLSSETNLKQLHFHSKDNQSFLRMHKPKKFGDDLSEIRRSVYYVNQYKQPIDGFEEGRIHSGFRFVFPLFYNNEYLGSVETSFATCSLRDNLKTDVYDVCVIVKKSEVYSKVDKDELLNYIKTDISSNYLREKSIIPSNYMNEEVIESIKSEFNSHEKLNRSFSIFSDKNGGVIISFVPIKSVDSNRYVGYVVVVKQEKFMLDMLHLYIFSQLLALFIVLNALFFSIRRELYLSIIKKQNDTFNSIYKNTLDGVILFKSGRVVDCNEAACRQIGLESKEAFIGYSALMISPIFQPDSQRSATCLNEYVRKVLRNEQVNFDWLIKKVDGTTFWVNIELTKVYIDSKLHIHAHFRDTSLKHEAQETVEKERSFLQSVIDAIESSVRVVSRDKSIQLMNKKALQDAQNANVCEINHSLFDVDKSLKRIHKYKNGMVGEVVTTPLLNEKGDAYALIETVYDITNITKANEEIANQVELSEYKATHDALTQLANRTLLIEKIDSAIDNKKGHSEKIALLFIDLDNFKEINDSLGHRFGDEVLVSIAKRLEKCVEKNDVLARLGGDEFIILVDNMEDITSIIVYAKKVLHQIKVPLFIENREIFVTMSIGISIYPDDASSSNHLLKNADAAMYQAKNSGKDTFEFYSKEMTILSLKRITLEAELRKAIINDEFIVHYQAQVDGRKHKIIGLEALVRWYHPTKGMISPSEFIALAEDTGLIVDLDFIVAEHVFQQAKLWKDKGLDFGMISINLSMVMLQRGRFIEKVGHLLKRYALSASNFQFEITETQIMTNVDKSINDISQLKEMGFSIAIDDFGTGYSSLAYLKKLPIDKLKIDKSFIDFIPRSEEDNSIVKAIIALADSLKLKIIAEGVEELEQEHFLNENGCSEIQGYLYSKPINSAQMGEFLKNW